MVYIGPSAHDSSVIASDDGYYIMPEYRGSGLARRLLQYSDKRLKELGVDYFLMSSRAVSGGANVGLLFEDEGFKPFAVAYSKAL
jgi:GNAT superfamily N-acetyltransferase